MRQLPTSAAFVHALKSTVSNIHFAFRVSWLWLIIMYAADVITTYKFVLPLRGETGPEAEARLFLAQAPSMLVSLVAISSIAVTWHRYVLRDEWPTAQQLLRLDATVLRYMGNLIGVGVLVSLFLFLPVLVVQVVSNTLGIPDSLLMIPLVVLGTMLSFQLSIKLPAIALGRQDFTFREALNQSGGNYAPLLGFTVFVLLTTLVVMAAFGIVARPIYESGNDLALFIVLGLGVLVKWMLAIFSATTLTSLYGFFIERREF
jgi:hypothetical protein